MSRLLGISDDDIIFTILSWLGLRDHELLDMAITNIAECKRWMTYLLSADLSHTMTRGHTHSLLRWLIKRKVINKSIRCHEGETVDVHSFVGMEMKMIHLFRSGITDEGLLMIAQGCHQLNTIQLSDCRSVTNKGLLALATNLRGIISINLEELRHVTSAGVIAIAEGCPALLEISLNGSALATHDSILAIAQGCPKLQTIGIHNSREILDESIQFFASRCKDLRSFSLSECTRITDVAITVIANSCTDIESLSISCARGTSPEYHTLATAPVITNQCLIAVGEKCSKLVNFSITHSSISDMGVIAVATGCLQLRSFSAHNCPYLSIRGVMNLSYRCKELRDVAIEECALVNNYCLRSIAEACSELTSLTLSRDNKRCWHILHSR